MPTFNEQSAAIKRDEDWRHKKRLRVVLEYQDNGHAIERTLFEYHEVKSGQEREGVALTALQHAQDKIEPC